jgi:NADH-quinone oxidoreductase subunit M
LYALLLQSVLLPIIGSPFAYLLGRKIGTKSAWFSFVIMLYSTGAMFYISATQLTNGVYQESYQWFPVSVSSNVPNSGGVLSTIGVFGLWLDGISIPFVGIIYLLSTVLTVYSIPYMTHRIKEDLEERGQSKEQFNRKFGEYYALYLLYAAGMVGVVLSTNLVELYFFFEFMLIPSFFLIAEFGYGARGRISFMYLLWTHAGALLLLIGILAIGVYGNSFVFLPNYPFTIPFQLGVIIAIVITVGLFVKLAAVGLHIWLPYAHAEAPTPISALLSPAMIGIGGYVLFRLLEYILPREYQTISLGIAIWGVLTMFYGGFMALAQDDVKRLFAYSSVSQMGYLIFGLGAGNAFGVSGAVFQFVSHGTSKAILFMIAGAIIMQANGLRSISKMGGLSHKLPITASTAMIGFLGIMGIPATNGFQSEWLIFLGGFAAAFASGFNAIRFALSVLGLIATLVSAGYALLTMKRIFFGNLPQELSNVKEAGASVTIPLLVLAIATVVTGFYPSLVDGNLIPKTTSLFP